LPSDIPELVREDEDTVTVRLEGEGGEEEE
jgi:hypothetical protein